MAGSAERPGDGLQNLFLQDRHGSVALFFIAAVDFNPKGLERARSERETVGGVCGFRRQVCGKLFPRQQSGEQAGAQLFRAVPELLLH